MFKKIVSNTDTTYHSYYEDDRHDTCDALILNPVHKTECVDCGKMCCISCALIKVANPNGYVCKNCLEKREYNKIYRAISSSPLLQQLSETNPTASVVCTISHFAVGVTVKCCWCRTEINISNSLDLNARMDHLGLRISFYYPHITDNIILYDNYIDNKIVTRDIYGVNTRIFCTLCTMHELKACASPDCQIIDCDVSENNICRVGGHPECIECGVLGTRAFYSPGWWDYHYKCTICKTRFTCSVCMRQRKSFESIDCRKCLVLQETNELSSILSSIIDNRVAHIIAQYAIGYIIMCCNAIDECQGEIILDDQWYFLRQIDVFEKKISYDWCAESDCDGNVRFLYNSTYRIFCSVCCASDRLEHCDSCSLLEPFGNGGYGGYGYGGHPYNICYGAKLNLCGRHSRCDICGKRGEECRSQEMTTCSGCKKSFCVRCGTAKDILCRYCIVKEEVSMFVDTLYSMQIVADINISAIIASYAIGYVVQCCNFGFCDKELSILNGYEFHQFSNESLWQSVYSEKELTADQKYYHYNVDAAINAEGTFWYIYNRQIRIFCVDCYKNGCKKCAFGARNYSFDCTNFDTMYYCLDHRKCIVCKKWQKSADLSYGYCPLRGQKEFCCKLCKLIPDDDIFHDIVYELSKYELSKYDDSECFKKMCKPYSLV